MVSVQEWKNGVLAQTQDADHIKTAEALAELLEGSSSPADIAKIITTVYEPPPETRRDCSHAGENKKVTEFWVTHMTDAISLFGDVDTQDRLLALLVEMSKQPDVRNPDGVLKGAGGCAIYWRDLPEWEWQFSNYGLSKSRSFLVDRRLLTRHLSLQSCRASLFKGIQQEGLSESRPGPSELDEICRYSARERPVYQWSCTASVRYPATWTRTTLQ